MRAKQRMCPSAHPDLCLAAIPPGGRSGGWDDPAMKHANPYAGLVGPLAPAGLEDLSDAVEERRLRDETGSGTLAEAAEMLRPPPPCPRCGASLAWRDGFGPSGVRRRRCPASGARSTPLAGTVLEGCKKPLATCEPCQYNGQRNCRFLHGQHVFRTVPAEAMQEFFERFYAVWRLR